MTESRVIPYNPNARTFFQLDFQNCETNFSDEIDNNHSIVGRLRNILAKRNNRPTSFVNGQLRKPSIDISNFPFKKTEYLSVVPEKFALPLYEIKTDNIIYINRTDKKTYCLQTGYYFNNEAQAVKYFIAGKTLPSRHQKEIKVPTGEISVYLKLYAEDYLEIKRILTLIENGVCLESSVTAQRAPFV